MGIKLERNRLRKDAFQRKGDIIALKAFNAWHATPSEKRRLEGSVIEGGCLRWGGRGWFVEVHDIVIYLWNK